MQAIHVVRTQAAQRHGIATHAPAIWDTQDPRALKVSFDISLFSVR